MFELRCTCETPNRGKSLNLAIAINSTCVAHQMLSYIVPFRAPVSRIVDF